MLKDSVDGYLKTIKNYKLAEELKKMAAPTFKCRGDALNKL